MTVRADGWVIVYDPGEPLESRHWSDRTRKENAELSRRRVAAELRGCDPTVKALCLAACLDADLAPLGAAVDRLLAGESPDLDMSDWDTLYLPWYARLLRRGWKRVAQLVTGLRLDREDVLTTWGK